MTEDFRKGRRPEPIVETKRTGGKGSLSLFKNSKTNDIHGTESLLMPVTQTTILRCRVSPSLGACNVTLLVMQAALAIREPVKICRTQETQCWHMSRLLAHELRTSQGLM